MQLQDPARETMRMQVLQRGCLTMQFAMDGGFLFHEPYLSVSRHMSHPDSSSSITRKGVRNGLLFQESEVDARLGPIIVVLFPEYPYATLGIKILRKDPTTLSLTCEKLSQRTGIPAMWPWLD